MSADDEAAPDELYWGHFWSSQCSYPNRTGDYRTVTRVSDFEAPAGPPPSPAPCPTDSSVDST